MARFGNSQPLFLFGAALLYACGGETFRARDDALAGGAGEAGASDAGTSGRTGAGGSAAGSGPLMNGGIGGQATAEAGSAPHVAGGSGVGAGFTGSAGTGASAGDGGESTTGMGGDGGLGSAGSGGVLQGGGGAGGSGGTGEVVGGCGEQLLHNANFDAGPTPEWSEHSTWAAGLDIIVPRDAPALMAEGVAPDSGEYLAWLGGIPDNQFEHYRVTLAQVVTVPAEAGVLTLTGKTRVKTEEDNSYQADEAFLEFSLDDVVVWQAKALTNLDSEDGSDWVAFTASSSDLNDIRGQTLTFVAYSRTDPTLKTSFWIDSLRLEATCDR